MLLRVPAVLNADALARIRSIVRSGEWIDGRATAGSQSEQVKNNRQLADESEAALAARAIVLDALGRNGLFFSAALPKKIFPPLFNRYEGAANAFGNHVDNAVRTVPGTRRHVRTDVSATVFLADPDDYDGGELVIEDTYGAQTVKLPAGDMILYPASSVHRVQPVTRGTRIASFFWIESMVRDDARRRLLFDLDVSIHSLRHNGGTDIPHHADRSEIVRLTGCYHNLLRMWAQP